MKLLAFDIGGTHIKGALFNNSQRVFVFEEPTAPTKQRFLNQLTSIIDAFISKHTIKAIGIGIPGPFKDYAKSILGKLSNLPLRNVPLKVFLEQRYRIPIVLENDANCFTLGEWLFDKAKGYKHAIGITLGTGMGVGIIANNALFRGKGNAGEFSHAPYLDAVFEEYVSKRAILHYAAANKIHATDPRELAQQRYKKIWETFGKHLGIAVSILHQTFDPEIIVLGGQLSRAHRYFLPSMKKTLKKYATIPLPTIAISTKNYALEAAAWLAKEQLKEKGKKRRKKHPV